MAAVKFPGKCKVCGEAIAVGTGDVRKENGKWVTTCDAHKGTIPNPDGYTRRYTESRKEYNQRQNGHRRDCECRRCEWDEC